MRRRVFLSYRREDSAAWAGRLHDALAARFGARHVHQDVAGVRAGDDFTGWIDEALAQSDAVVVVIGPRWLGVVDGEGNRRLDGPDDYVRYELATALATDRRVVPVLVGGATMPVAAQLPSGLEPLALRQAVTLRDEQWASDVDALVRALRDEDDASGRGTRWWLVAAAGLVVVLATVVAVRALTSGDDDSGITGCPGPETSGWTPVDIVSPPPASVGPWNVGILGVSEKLEGGGGWQMMVDLEATNDGPDQGTDGGDMYALVVDGARIVPWCFSVTLGEEDLDQGLAHEARVGFNIVSRTDPATRELALDVRADDQETQIPLT